MVGHQGLWPPTASLGTRKDLAGGTRQKGGTVLLPGCKADPHPVPPGRSRRCALIRIRGAGRNLLVLAAGRADDRAATVPTGNSLVRASY